MCYCEQRNEFNCLVLTLDVEKLEGVFFKKLFHVFAEMLQ